MPGVKELQLEEVRKKLINECVGKQERKVEVYDKFLFNFHYDNSVVQQNDIKSDT